MRRYRTSFTAGDGMLTVVVDREHGGHVARFSWLPEETDGALGELAAALAAIEHLEDRRARSRATPRGRHARRPRQVPGEVSMLDGIDQAIELLELAGGAS